MRQRSMFKMLPLFVTLSFAMSAADGAAPAPDAKPDDLARVRASIRYFMTGEYSPEIPVDPRALPTLETIRDKMKTEIGPGRTDIPSARGIGYLADADSIDIGVFSGDFYHTHLAGDPPIVESVNTALTALDNQIAAQNQALGITLDTGYVDPEDREKFRQRHSATLAKVCTLLSTYTNDQVNPYLISHSYEFVSRKYYRGQDDDTMNNQDPLRHIKTVFGGNITLYLGNGLWEVKQISFFVERNGKIRLIVPSLTEPTLSMQILDALHEID